MPKGIPHLIEYRGQPMSLREFADAIGIDRRTVQSRWSRGERSIELLARPPNPLYIRKRKASANVSAILATWERQ